MQEPPVASVAELNLFTRQIVYVTVVMTSKLVTSARPSAFASDGRLIDARGEHGVWENDIRR